MTQTARSAAFIGGSAVRILDRLGLGSDYRALGSSIHQLIVENTKGREIISFKPHGYGTELWTVPSDYLMQLFLEAIPSDSVYFDHNVRSLRVHKSTVHVAVRTPIGHRHLDMPHAPMNLFDTDFVIGADGLNSTVRTAMSRTVMTLPSGVLIWRAVIRHVNCTEIPFHVAKEIWHSDKRFGYVRITQELVMWWAIVSNMNEVILRPFAPHLQKMFKQFPHPVTKLLSSVDSDRQIYRKEMKYVWPQQLPWFDDSSARIALVGDAGRPGNTENFHTGHSFAVEDAYVLANLLIEQRDANRMDHLAYALQKYNDNREAHSKKSTKVATQVAHLADSQSIVGRYFATRFLRNSVDKIASQGISSILKVHEPKSSAAH